MIEEEWTKHWMKQTQWEKESQSQQPITFSISTLPKKSHNKDSSNYSLTSHSNTTSHSTILCHLQFPTIQSSCSRIGLLEMVSCIFLLSSRSSHLIEISSIWELKTFSIHLMFILQKHPATLFIFKSESSLKIYISTSMVMMPKQTALTL